MLQSAGSSESLGGSVGLLDSLSTGSMVDIAANVPDGEPVIPNIVAACLRHIENYGLHILGIFRVSSSKKRVRQVSIENFAITLLFYFSNMTSEIAEWSRPAINLQPTTFA